MSNASIQTAALAAVLAPPAFRAPPDAPTGSLCDFDFLVGEWDVASRRLKKRWAASPQWEEFVGVSRLEKRLDGLANIEELSFPTKGFSGLTVRLFDLEDQRWSIFWASSRDGRLTPPMFGGYLGDRGDFVGEDTDEGAPVKVRFLWLRRGARGHPRWEQSFSRDGRRWEINWIMDFTPRRG
jgi:hypothetical protein